MNELEGKVVMVTGAARGQGRAHAVTCARAGADVIALDTDRQTPSVPYSLATAADLAETAQLVESLERQVVALSADVRSQTALDEAVLAGLEAFGHIDICVANAGIWSIGSFWELDEGQWNDVIDVNLSGVWRTAKAVAPHMMDRRTGCIIMTGSVNSLEGGKRGSSLCRVETRT